MKRFLLALFLAGVLLSFGRADELVVCGDGVCSAGESRSVCPIDCCLTHSDGVCQWFSECATQDPDCCDSGCFSPAYVCTANVRGQACYPGRCSSGACDSSCFRFYDCPSGFCGTDCSSSCIHNGDSAADFESCCECFSSGTCQACNTLSVKGIGFFIYRERRTSFPIQLYNASAAVTNVSISVSGPLKEYVSLVSNDRLWRGDGFSRINPGEVKAFYTNLEDIPDDLAGMHQLKYSITYDTGTSSHLVWVAVLPVDVMQQGRDPPSKGTVGVTRTMMRMSYNGTTVPVEVVLQVW